MGNVHSHLLMLLFLFLSTCVCGLFFRSSGICSAVCPPGSCMVLTGLPITVLTSLDCSSSPSLGKHPSWTNHVVLVPIPKVPKAVLVSKIPFHLFQYPSKKYFHASPHSFSFNLFPKEIHTIKCICSYWMPTVTVRYIKKGSERLINEQDQGFKPMTSDFMSIRELQIMLPYFQKMAK